MFLNVILTLLVIVLIVIFVSLRFWWKKFGVKLFDMMDQMKSMSNQIPKSNPKEFMGDFKQQMDSINQAFKMLGNMGKKQ